MEKAINKIMAILVVAFMLGSGLCVLTNAPNAQADSTSGTVEEGSYTADTPVFVPNPENDNVRLSELTPGTYPIGWMTITVAEDGTCTFVPTTVTGTNVTLYVDKTLTRSGVAGEEFTLTIPEGSAIVVLYNEKTQTSGYLDFTNGDKLADNKGTINVYGGISVELGGKINYYNGFNAMTVNIQAKGQYQTYVPFTSGSTSGPSVINVNDYGTLNYYMVAASSDYLRELNLTGIYSAFNQSYNYTVPYYDAILKVNTFTTKNKSDLTIYGVTLYVTGYTDSSGTYVPGKMDLVGLRELRNEASIVIGGYSGGGTGESGAATLSMTANYAYITNNGYFTISSYYGDNYSAVKLDSSSYYGGFYNNGYLTIYGDDKEYVGNETPKISLTCGYFHQSRGYTEIYRNGAIFADDFEIDNDDGTSGVYFYGNDDVSSKAGIYIYDDLMVNDDVSRGTVTFSSARFFFPVWSSGYQSYLALKLSAVVYGYHWFGVDGPNYVEFYTGSSTTNAGIYATSIEIVMHGVDLELECNIYNNPELTVVNDKNVIYVYQDYQFSSLKINCQMDIFRTYDQLTHYIAFSENPQLGDNSNVSSNAEYEFKTYTDLIFAINEAGIVEETVGTKINLVVHAIEGLQTGVKSISADYLWGVNGHFDLTKVKVVCHDGWMFDGWYEMKTTVISGQVIVTYQKVIDPTDYYAEPGSTLVAMAVQAPVATHDYSLTLGIIAFLLVIIAAVGIVYCVMKYRFG